MRLKIQNYGIIEKLDAPLSPGLTVLIGPNGSGKSTFVDALYFAVTGETIDGRNVAERINWGTLDGKAVVTLVDDEFSVERTIKKAGVTHKLTTASGVVTKKQDVNDFLFSRWGIDSANVLKDVFFAAQLHATDLFDSTDSARLALLTKVFGFDKLEQCRAVILKVLADTPAPSVNNELVASVETKVSLDKESVDSTRSQLSSVSEKMDAVNFDQAEYQRVMALPVSGELESRQQLFKQASEWLDENLPKLSAMQVDVADLEKRSEFGNYLKCSKDSNEQLKKIEDEIYALVDGGPSIEALNDALAAAHKQRGKAVVELESLQSRLGADSSVCPLIKGTPCIELLRLNDPELLKSAISEKEGEIATIDGDIQQLQQFFEERTKVSERLASLTALQEITVKAMPRKPEEPQEWTELSADQVLEKLPGVEQHLANAKELLTKLEADIRTNTSLRDSSKQWLDQHPVQDTVSSEDKATWQERYTTYQTLLTEKSRLVVQLDAYSDALKNDEQTLQQLRADKAKAEEFAHKCEVLKTTRELLSKGQLQRLLLKSTIESLNREVEVCASLLGFKYSVYITEEGSIKFNGDAVEGADVKALSGGQKYAAAIVMRLAFARVLHAKFPFVVLDEPSTCLDVSSRKLLAGLLTALHTRNQKTGEFLVVPTHDEMLVSATNQIINIGEV